MKTFEQALHIILEPNDLRIENNQEWRLAHKAVSLQIALHSKHLTQRDGL